MAEATGLRNNALPYPVYGVPFGVSFPILDADGDPVTGAAGLDSEVSLNGDTFTDCDNEATEIATNSGIYYLLLTAANMTADLVTVRVQTSTSGAKTTVLTLPTRKLVPIRSGTSQAPDNASDKGYVKLDSSASAIDDFYNGCLCVATIDSVVEARIIDDYNGTTKNASVTPDWNTATDNDDTFVIYLPEGVQIPTVNATHIGGTSQTGRDIGASVLLATDQAVNVTKWGGTAVASAYVQANAAQWGGAALPTIGTSTLTTGDIDARLAAWGKTGFALTGTVTTFDALLTSLASAHGAGSWATATGFSTHSASDVVTALGTGSTLTALAPSATALSTATWTNTKAGYLDAAVSTRSSHAASDVVTALGAGSTLTALATAASITTIDTLLGRMAPRLIGTVTGAGEGSEVFVYAGVTVTYTVTEEGNISAVVFT